MSEEIEIDIIPEIESMLLKEAKMLLYWIDPASKELIDYSSLEKFESTAGIAIINSIMVEKIKKAVAKMKES